MSPRLFAPRIGLLRASVAGTADQERVRARAWDITAGPPPELLPAEAPNSPQPETADLALLVFTLSAVRKEW